MHIDLYAWKMIDSKGIEGLVSNLLPSQEAVKHHLFSMDNESVGYEQ
jgi:hypothetical protein